MISPRGAHNSLVSFRNVNLATAGVTATRADGAILVFFLHVTTGPDNVNNVMALAFGVLIVFLVIVGSLSIMAHMSHNMMSMDQIMQMQR